MGCSHSNVTENISEQIENNEAKKMEEEEKSGYDDKADKKVFNFNNSKMKNNTIKSKVRVDSVKLKKKKDSKKQKGKYDSSLVKTEKCILLAKDNNENEKDNINENLQIYEFEDNNEDDSEENEFYKDSKERLKHNTTITK